MQYLQYYNFTDKINLKAMESQKSLSTWSGWECSESFYLEILNVPSKQKTKNTVL